MSLVRTVSNEECHYWWLHDTLLVIKGPKEDELRGKEGSCKKTNKKHTMHLPLTKIEESRWTYLSEESKGPCIWRVVAFWLWDPLLFILCPHTLQALLAYCSSLCAWFDMAWITIFLPVIGIHTRRGEWGWGADGDIPHDQTDQSACWDAGAAQAGSATPSISPSTGHKHMGTNRGTLRVCMLLCPAAPRLMTSEFPIRFATGCQERERKTVYNLQ